ncbi:MAG: YabP/YqfC family sporulation protein [Hungatella sp.]
MLEHAGAALVSAFKLPQDVMLGEVLLSIVGRQVVLIENYKSIILYADHCVKLQTKNGKLTINGEHLIIEYYTKDEMKITGRIRSVELDGV